MADESGHPHLRDQLHELEDKLESAAIQAEFETGRRESTEAEAKAHIAKRLLRMTAGFLLLIVGIAAIPLPGPGWAIVAAALVILAQDFVWAERTLRFVRRRVPGVPEEGSLPRSTLYMMGGASTLAIGASVWWYALR
jgi:uncharacterized protein (TIGR02611 family)